MKIRLLLIIIIILNLNLTGCNEYGRDERYLVNLIEDFLNSQYEAYVNLEYIDIERFLDMSRIQNKNKVIALKKIIIQRKHVEDMKYALVNKHKYPFKIVVNDININGEYASLKIDIELDKNKDYPNFISEGLNCFILQVVDDTWKIVYHDYDGFTLFETSNNELLPDIDEERIRRVIDNEYVTPFS